LVATCSSGEFPMDADASTWNLDLQELEYNLSRKDMSDARIHHLLSEELYKPYRRVISHDKASNTLNFNFIRWISNYKIILVMTHFYSIVDSVTAGMLFMRRILQLAPTRMSTIDSKWISKKWSARKPRKRAGIADQE